jgi:hypothetical protein
MPTQALNAYMGTTVRNMEDVMEDSKHGYVMISMQIVVSVILMIYVIRRARKELNRACRQAEDVEAGQRSITVEPSLLRVMSHNNVKFLDGKNGVVNSYDLLKMNQTKHQRSKSVSLILPKFSIDRDHPEETVNDD